MTAVHTISNIKKCSGGVPRPYVAGSACSCYANLQFRWRTTRCKCDPTLFVFDSSCGPPPSRTLCILCPTFITQDQELQPYQYAPRAGIAIRSLSMRRTKKIGEQLTNPTCPAFVEYRSSSTGLLGCLACVLDLLAKQAVVALCFGRLCVVFNWRGCGGGVRVVLAMHRSCEGRRSGTQQAPNLC